MLLKGQPTQMNQQNERLKNVFSSVKLGTYVYIGFSIKLDFMQSTFHAKVMFLTPCI